MELVTQFIVWLEFYEASGEVQSLVKAKGLPETSSGAFPKGGFIGRIVIEVTRKGVTRQGGVEDTALTTLEGLCERQS